jgi:hypothetical protein
MLHVESRPSNGASGHRPTSIHIANPSGVNRYHEKPGAQSFARSSLRVAGWELPELFVDGAIMTNSLHYLDPQYLC